VQHWDFECGLRIAVQRQGLFLFDFSNCTSRLFPTGSVIGSAFETNASIERRRVELMSAHALLLHSGVLQCDGLTLAKYRPRTESLVVMDKIDGGGMGIGREPGLGDLVMTPFRSTYRPDILRSQDSRIFFRSTISLGATDDAATHLDQLLKHRDAEMLLEAVSLLNEAAAFAEEHHYSLSLTIAWTVCERLLNRCWIGFLDDHKRSGDGSGSIDKLRRRRLNDNRTYSSAVKAEILCFGDVIDLPLYERLAALRKLRNDWIHGADNREVSTTDAATAIAVASEMLKTVLAFDCRVSLYLSIHG
jgi:hypothetical protein